MTLYHVWCNLKPGVLDTDFTDAVDGYLGHLREERMIEGWRITRRQLGLGPKSLPEFHIMIELTGLTQFDGMFTAVSSRREPIESLHHAVNSKAQDVIFALYRDFPDPNRHRGEEKF